MKPRGRGLPTRPPCVRKNDERQDENTLSCYSTAGMMLSHLLRANSERCGGDADNMSPMLRETDVDAPLLKAIGNCFIGQGSHTMRG